MRERTAVPHVYLGNDTNTALGNVSMPVWRGRYGRGLTPIDITIIGLGLFVAVLLGISVSGMLPAA